MQFPDYMVAAVFPFVCAVEGLCIIIGEALSSAYPSYCDLVKEGICEWHKRIFL